MYIAGEKRKTNIAEYIIYMFQVEDIIRSLQFDIGKIEEQIIQKYELPYSDKRDLREWYSSIIRHLKDNGCVERGHTPFLNNLISEINDLHIRLLAKPEEFKYHKLYSNSRAAIDELRTKSGSTTKNDIEISLEGIYGLFLLRLAKKKISPETEEAFRLISEMLSCLSVKFKGVDEGLSEL